MSNLKTDCSEYMFGGGVFLFEIVLYFIICFYWNLRIKKNNNYLFYLF